MDKTMKRFARLQLLVSRAVIGSVPFFKSIKSIKNTIKNMGLLRLACGSQMKGNIF